MAFIFESIFSILSIWLNFLLRNRNLSLYSFNFLAKNSHPGSLSIAMTLVLLNFKNALEYPPWPKVQSINVPPFWGEIMLRISLAVPDSVYLYSVKWWHYLFLRRPLIFLSSKNAGISNSSSSCESSLVLQQLRSLFWKIVFK